MDHVAKEVEIFGSLDIVDGRGLRGLTKHIKHAYGRTS